MNKRLRLSAVLILAGLIIELITLAWAHPLSFFLFLFLGGLLIAAGIVFYLISLTLAPGVAKENEK